jgi:hypothetical protein
MYLEESVLHRPVVIELTGKKTAPIQYKLFERRSGISE